MYFVQCPSSHQIAVLDVKPTVPELSLVHTYATRHDTTACDTTGQRTKARRIFSLVPHIIHDTTMRLDSDLLQTPWQFCGVQLITRLFTRG